MFARTCAVQLAPALPNRSSFGVHVYEEPIVQAKVSALRHREAMGNSKPGDPEKGGKGLTNWTSEQLSSGVNTYPFDHGAGSKPPVHYWAERM